MLKIAASILVLLAGPAVGGPHTLAGAGATTCSKFAFEYAKDPDFIEAPYFSWAQGFMSATNEQFANLGAPSQMRNLGGRPHADQRKIIRDYCDKHPLRMYAEAVRALYLSLPLKGRP